MHITHFPLDNYTDRLVSIAMVEPIEPSLEFTQCVQKYVRRVIASKMWLREPLSILVENFKEDLKPFGALARLTAEEACADNNVISENRPWPANNFQFVDKDIHTHGVDLNLFSAAYEKFVMKIITEWNQECMYSVVDPTLVHRLERKLSDAVRLLCPAMLRTGHSGFSWDYTELSRSVERSVDSLSALRGIRSYRKEIIGHEFTFNAPSHQFTVVMDRDFRSVNIEGGACWCIPGVENWLPSNLDLHVN